MGVAVEVLVTATTSMKKREELVIEARCDSLSRGSVQPPTADASIVRA